MGIHDHGEGGHDDTVHDHGDILDDGENIACADGADASDHPPAAKIDDEDHGQIEQQHGKRHQDAHGDVAANDVLGHDVGSLVDPLMLPFLGVKGADDADATQTFPHDGVLLVDV